MINFFRKIRKKLLTENKLTKYLIYAIGEIILVVIGILIALNLNIRNEQKKTSAKVEAIFMEILDEISSDIDKTTELMSFYEKKDTVAYLVLNDKLTYEDYSSGKMPNLFNLTTFYRNVFLSRVAYNNLIQDLDAIPSKFKLVLKDLNNLYNSRKDHVDRFDLHMSTLVQNNIDIRSRNYSWFAGTKPSDRKNEIEFYLDDFRYKNEVFRYHTSGVRDHLNQTIQYRKKAIECYKKIAILLNIDDLPDSFKIDWDKNLLGEWNSEQVPGLIVTMYEEDGRWLYKTNNDAIIREIFSFSPTKIVDDIGNFFTILKEGDEYVSKLNEIEYRKIK